MVVSMLLATSRLMVPLTLPPAYLDPGSGSFILQLLIAGILGGLVALRMYWGKIKAHFTRKPEDAPEDKAGE
jgi:hypothetical protein